MTKLGLHLAVIVTALVGFVVAFGHDARAETRVPYQLSISKQCAFAACTFNFPTTPAGRRIEVEQINCQLGASYGVLLLDAIVSPQNTRLHLSPTWVRYPQSGVYTTFNQSAALSIPAHNALIISATNNGGTSFQIDCGIFGTLVFL